MKKNSLNFLKKLHNPSVMHLPNIIVSFRCRAKHIYNTNHQQHTTKKHHVLLEQIVHDDGFTYDIINASYIHFVYFLFLRETTTLNTKLLSSLHIVHFIIYKFKCNTYIHTHMRHVLPKTQCIYWKHINFVNWFIYVLISSCKSNLNCISVVSANLQNLYFIAYYLFLCITCIHCFWCVVCVCVFFDDGI